MPRKSQKISCPPAPKAVPPNVRPQVQGWLNAVDKYASEVSDGKFTSMALPSMTLDELNGFLQGFFRQLKRKDGYLYPPTSIATCFRSLNHYIRSTRQDGLDLSKDERFAVLRELVETRKLQGATLAGSETWGAHGTRSVKKAATRQTAKKTPTLQPPEQNAGKRKERPSPSSSEISDVEDSSESQEIEITDKAAERTEPASDNAVKQMAMETEAPNVRLHEREDTPATAHMISESSVNIFSDATSDEDEEDAVSDTDRASQRTFDDSDSYSDLNVNDLNTEPAAPVLPSDRTLPPCEEMDVALQKILSQRKQGVGTKATTQDRNLQALETQGFKTVRRLARNTMMFGCDDRRLRSPTGAGETVKLTSSVRTRGENGASGHRPLDQGGIQKSSELVNQESRSSNGSGNLMTAIPGMSTQSVLPDTNHGNGKPPQEVQPPDVVGPIRRHTLPRTQLATHNPFLTFPNIGNMLPNAAPIGMLRPYAYSPSTTADQRMYSPPINSPPIYSPPPPPPPTAPVWDFHMTAAALREGGVFEGLAGLLMSASREGGRIAVHFDS
ncbi:uncharacterized protein EV422DRAFT_562612 [Fimicolochytrium jonesii]|uniref:uncharacterized protein n=1 Tax=Fimicolochytrium jonesii TaxID=1396493 RepID=UPI0022FE37A6|nr:uncharacterized protein EV422DRAFT_562612 [Fimicolochytrium jonesii]KAI8826553.1 hypothetical protein EV422DRAFT_562612 [Fimicolochytrium jonesii]